MKQSSLLNILFSPVRFFQLRIQAALHWRTVAAIVVVQVVLVTATSLVTANKQSVGGSLGVSPLANVGFVVTLLFSVVEVVGSLAVLSFAGVLCDVLLSISGRIRRLVEFTVYSSLPVVIWTAVALGVLAFIWDPAPFSIRAGESPDAMMARRASYQSNLANPPLQLSFGIVSAWVAAWKIALQAAALRVVSKFSVPGAVAFWIVAVRVFVVLPWFATASLS